MLHDDVAAAGDYGDSDDGGNGEDIEEDGDVLMHGENLAIRVYSSDNDSLDGETAELVIYFDT